MKNHDIGCLGPGWGPRATKNRGGSEAPGAHVVNISRRRRSGSSSGKQRKGLAQGGGGLLRRQGGFLERTGPLDTLRPHAL